MEVRAVHKFARISDQKARQVTRAIKGMPVSQAISALTFTPKKAATLVGKVLRSAVANAENNHSLDAEDLIVKNATATKGPILHRHMPRARGSAAGIKKRMSHITVIVAAKEEEENEAPKAARGSKKAAKTQKPSKKAEAQAPAAPEETTAPAASEEHNS